MAKQKDKEEGLTESQKVFCREYIFDWNATRAYQKAYPECSYESAISAGSRLLTNVKIQKYCTEIQEDLEKLAGISRFKVITEHQKIAFSSIAHLHNTWITRKEFESLTDDQKSAIEEISTQTRFEKDYTVNPDDPEGTVMQVDYVKIKLYSKQKSLDSINKMLGYEAPKKVQISTPEKQVIYIGGNKIEF